MASRRKNTPKPKAEQREDPPWIALKEFVQPALARHQSGATYIDLGAIDAAFKVLTIGARAETEADRLRLWRAKHVFWYAVNRVLAPTANGDKWLRAAYAGYHPGKDVARVAMLEAIRSEGESGRLPKAVQELPQGKLSVEYARVRKGHGRGAYPAAARLSLAAGWDKRRKNESEKRANNRVATAFQSAEERILELSRTR